MVQSGPVSLLKWEKSPSSYPARARSAEVWSNSSIGHVAKSQLLAKEAVQAGPAHPQELHHCYWPGPAALPLQPPPMRLPPPATSAPHCTVPLFNHFRGGVVLANTFLPLIDCTCRYLGQLTPPSDSVGVALVLQAAGYRQAPRPKGCVLQSCGQSPRPPGWGLQTGAPRPRLFAAELRTVAPPSRLPAADNCPALHTAGCRAPCPWISCEALTPLPISGAPALQASPGATLPSRLRQERPGLALLAPTMEFKVLATRLCMFLDQLRQLADPPMCMTRPTRPQIQLPRHYSTFFSHPAPCRGGASRFWAVSRKPARSKLVQNGPTWPTIRGKIGVHKIFVKPELRWKPTSVNTKFSWIPI